MSVNIYESIVDKLKGYKNKTINTNKLILLSADTEYEL